MYCTLNNLMQHIRLIWGASCLLIFIYNLGLVLAGCDVDVAHEQGYFIFLIQAGPQHLGEGFHIIGNLYQLGLTLEAGQGIAVMHIGVDEMTLAVKGSLICKGVAHAGSAVTVVAL